MKTKYYIFEFLAGAGLTLFLAGTAQSGIIGTRHDFSQAGWNYTSRDGTNQICIVCHAPHNAIGASGTSAGLLWNHSLTMPTGWGHIPYDSPTIKYTPGQPDGASRLCLSCHDGTIAIDRFGGNPSVEYPYFMTGFRMLENDLRNDHPVSFVYDSVLVAAVKTLKDPAVSPSGLGGTVASDLLREGKVQCVSCHNPHNVANVSKFLVKSNERSALCLTCHNF